MKERLAKIIAHPFHQYLGITAIDSEAGVGSFSINVTENAVNPAGIFHGGVVYALCDVCAYSGLLSLIDETTEAVTHDIHVSIMQSARLGETVSFESDVMKLGRQVAFISVKAHVGSKLVATATVTKTLLQQS